MRHFIASVGEQIATSTDPESTVATDIADALLAKVVDLSEEEDMNTDMPINTLQQQLRDMLGIVFQIYEIDHSLTSTEETFTPTEDQAL